jgi:hypothetical protein
MSFQYHITIPDPPIGLFWCWYTSSVYNDENNKNNNTTWGATERCEWVSNPSYNEWDEIIIEFYEVHNVW